MAAATFSGAALRRLQFSFFLDVSAPGRPTHLPFFSSVSAPPTSHSAVNTYPVSTVATAAVADASSSVFPHRLALRRCKHCFLSPACATAHVELGTASRVRRRAAAAGLYLVSAGALCPRLAAVAAFRPLPAATATASFSFGPYVVSTFPCFFPLSGVADWQQQRGYRHWARHRAFEKIRRLPNRALRPGCCAASLFPPSISSSSCIRVKAFSGSSGSSDSSTVITHDSTSSSGNDSRTSHSNSFTHTNTSDGTNKRTRTITGIFSPNIMGSMAVHGDYRVARSTGGGFRLVPPYPPRINKTIEPYPPSAVKYFAIHRSYPLQWRNVEYKYVPVRLPRPYGANTPAGGSTSGQGGAAWGGDIIRIFHRRKGWKRKEK